MATTEIAAPRRRHAVTALILTLCVFATAALVYGGLHYGGVLGARDEIARSERDSEGSETPDVITFEQGKWKAAGLRTEPAVSAPLLETLSRPGRVVMKRMATLSPMVEGIIADVRVNIGQNVKAGDELLVLDSKELGQAKLDLAKARLGLTIAAAQHDWVQSVNKNTTELLQAMAQNTSIADIDKRFAGRPIGDWRQQLVTAYSRRGRTETQLRSLEKLQGQGAVGEAALRAARGEYETAEAAFQAQREEIAFQNQQQLRSTAQKLREAEGQVNVAETYLLMVGYRKDEIAAMDPLKDGARVGHYPLRAPFDGTILPPPPHLGERASPQAPVLKLADLSQVWVQADVTESDLPVVNGLSGKKITFSGPGLAGMREAKVFHVGDVVDDSTRTIALRALAANADRRLRPGMFVQVQLHHGPDDAVVQLPSSAILRHAGETFVFVPRDDEKFEKVVVRLGRANADHVEIVAGVAAGQPVVVEGGFALKTEMLRASLNPEQ
jgi:RND family efflux transporter MFP subunit